jgi:hypothetical protein
LEARDISVCHFSGCNQAQAKCAKTERWVLLHELCGISFAYFAVKNFLILTAGAVKDTKYHKGSRFSLCDFAAEVFVLDTQGAVLSRAAIPNCDGEAGQPP